uniref:Uncharacterized protein n=1 Tax=Romanomermis culicivorax TaxID=13658 RepID=A0A915J7W4_ROMCU
KWGPKSTLTTAFFPDIVFEDDELRHYEILRSPVTNLAIYHWQLERYKNYEGSHLGASYLEEQIRVQTGYVLAKNFQREIFLNKSDKI